MKKLLVISAITLALFFSALPDYDEIDYLIKEMKYGLEIHEWYLENDYNRNLTGSEEWHIRWIDTYNRTISTLESYRTIMWWIR